MKFIGDFFINLASKWLLKTEPPRHAYLSDYDKIRYEVRSGDVLLVEGRHRVSNIIKQITQSPWSHAALYIGRLHDISDPAMRVKVKKHFKGPADTQLLIESMLGSGNIVVPLEKYRKEHVRICRPTSLTHEDAQRIISFAINRLGMKYSIRHIFDLFRFLVPYGILPRRWRSTLFSQKSGRATEDICSAMLGEAFGSVQFPIVPHVKYTKQRGLELIRHNPKLLTPSDFDYSPYFSIVKYPIFSVTSQAPYKKLPWDSNQNDMNAQSYDTYHTHNNKRQKKKKNGDNHKRSDTEHF